MKFTILNTEASNGWGGQEIRTFLEAVGMRESGHRLIIATEPESRLLKRAKNEGFQIIPVKFQRRSFIKIIRSFKRLTEKESIDIVNTHSAKDSWAGGIASLLTLRILVRYKHNLYRVKNPPTRFIYSLPRRFISVSNAATDALLQAGHIPRSKIKRIYAGINSNAFDPAKLEKNCRRDLRRSLGMPDNTLIIGNTSGFTEVKGQSYLLNAANKLFRMYDNLYL